ncbi:MAG: response regulator transcription factor [Candidatus Eremiobacteraeota bacterium]|nr:response regulator transcription factor [Candidatus Eremiobacteraeota bacterium]
MMETILIVDDEEAILDLLRINLARSGYQTLTASTGKEAISKIQTTPVDLILLDLQLPDMDGDQVTEEIRKISSIPVIFVTARGSDQDRIIGLEKGADDYITKPFNPREVTARVKAVLRRLEPRDKEKKVILGSLSLDILKRKVVYQNRPLELSPKEFDLLYFFVLNHEKILTREEILKQVWGTESMDTRTLDVHVKNLREKMKGERILKTVWGKGYIFTMV